MLHTWQPKYSKTTCESIYHHCTSYSHTLTEYSILEGRDVQLIKQWKVITLLAPLLEHRKQSNSANGRILTYLHTHSDTPTHTRTNTCKEINSFKSCVCSISVLQREEQWLQIMNFWRVAELTVTFFHYFTQLMGLRLFHTQRGIKAG